MAADVVIPEVGELGMGVTLVEWLKQPGDRVRAGEPILQVDTEKALFEVEAFADGVLADFQAQPGDQVGPKQIVARLYTEDEWSERKLQPPATEQVSTPSLEEARALQPSTAIEDRALTGTAPPAAGAAGAPASPRARALAERHGIDLRTVSGTGPRGRITERDVTALIEAGDAATAAESGSDRAHRVRRATAERTLAAWRSTPHFSLRLNADITETVADAKPMPVVCHAIARALADRPECNLEWRGDELARRQGVDIGVLVDTPQGLLLPAVRGADRMTIEEIGQAIAAAAERARSGKLVKEDVGSRSATISNLGMYAVDGFTGIIPQADVLLFTIGRTRVEARWSAEAPQPRTVIPITLSIDHRALDGADGARLLSNLEGHLTREDATDG